MHVAHLLSGLQIGGKERAALRLAQAGNGRGDRHELILFDTPFRSEAVDLPPGDVPTSFIPRGGGIDLSFVRRLARHLRSAGAEIVHAHNDTALFYAVAARLLMGRRPCRVVATFHTWPSHGSSRARILTRIAGMNAATVAVSDELTRRLVGTGWLTRCGTVWNGVELDRFTPDGPTGDWRERLGVGADSILVGHVARFDPIKRHDDLLQAARLLQDALPRVVFVLVGQGEALDAVRRRAAGLRTVRFVPQISDMPSFLRNLDAMVLCSAHEAAPLVLLEAMACGVPVVATAVGGIPHMLAQDGPHPAGLLVPPLDPHRLAEALQALACDPELRRRIGSRGIQRASGFAFQREWADYQALYSGQPDQVATDVAPRKDCVASPASRV